MNRAVVVVVVVVVDVVVVVVVVVVIVVVVVGVVASVLTVIDVAATVNLKNKTQLLPGQSELQSELTNARNKLNCLRR